MHVMMTLQRLVEGVAVGVGLGVPLRLGVREPVRDDVAERVRDGVAVGDAVGEPVEVVVGVSVDDAVGGAVGDAVGELVPLLVRVVLCDVLCDTDALPLPLLLALPAEPVADDAPGVPARNARSATASSVHRAAGGERMMIDASNTSRPIMESCDNDDSQSPIIYTQSPHDANVSGKAPRSCSR